MLRRRPDNTMEFRLVEAVFDAAGPLALTAASRERMRRRIFSRLGEQERAGSFANLPMRERWVAVPAGIGIAATVIASVRVVREPASSSRPGDVAAYALGSVTVDGLPRASAYPGQRIVANSEAWITVGERLRINMEEQAELQLLDDESLQVRLYSGEATFVTSSEGPLTVHGANWSAEVAASSVAEFATTPQSTFVRVIEGQVALHAEGAAAITVDPGDAPLVIPSGPGSAQPRFEREGQAVPPLDLEATAPVAPARPVLSDVPAPITEVFEPAPPPAPAADEVAPPVSVPPAPVGEPASNPALPPVLEPQAVQPPPSFAPPAAAQPGAPATPPPSDLTGARAPEPVLTAPTPPTPPAVMDSEPAAAAGIEAATPLPPAAPSEAPAVQSEAVHPPAAPSEQRPEPPASTPANSNAGTGSPAAQAQPENENDGAPGRQAQHSAEATDESGLKPGESPAEAREAGQQQPGQAHDAESRRPGTGNTQGSGSPANGGNAGNSANASSAPAVGAVTPAQANTGEEPAGARAVREDDDARPEPAAPAHEDPSATSQTRELPAATEKQPSNEPTASKDSPPPAKGADDQAAKSNAGGSASQGSKKA